QSVWVRAMERLHDIREKYNRRSDEFEPRRVERHSEQSAESREDDMPRAHEASVGGVIEQAFPFSVRGDHLGAEVVVANRRSALGHEKDLAPWQKLRKRRIAVADSVGPRRAGRGKDYDSYSSHPDGDAVVLAPTRATDTRDG